jgi:hypothetical protein
MDVEPPPLDPKLDEQGYKRCPDCAELVRAAARKCRFCGYRFDGEADEAHEPPRSRRGGRGGRSGPRDVRELLGEWAMEIASDEAVAFFLPARAKLLDRTDAQELFGYLLITDRRLLMIAPPARNMLALLRRDDTREPAEVALELDLADVSEVAVERRWRKAQLRLVGRALFDEIPAEQVERICRHIEVSG